MPLSVQERQHAIACEVTVNSRDMCEGCVTDRSVGLATGLPPLAESS
jgi:hypothetical protein